MLKYTSNRRQTRKMFLKNEITEKHKKNITKFYLMKGKPHATTSPHKGTGPCSGVPCYYQSEFERFSPQLIHEKAIL